MIQDKLIKENNMIKKEFADWNYSAVQELESLCSSLPILSENRAKAILVKAGKLTRQKATLTKRQSGSLFDSMMGFVSASDRKDFSALLDNNNPETFG